MARRRVDVQISDDLDAVYANFAMISQTASEIIIDFASVLPRARKARVQTRIVTTPLHAKLLASALQENLEEYEEEHGEIRIPASKEDLAREFFGGDGDG